MKRLELSVWKAEFAVQNAEEESDDRVAFLDIPS
jgi:hypothetical protein